MKKLLFSLVMSILAFNAMCNNAKFSYFSYSGNDSRFEKKIESASEYLNPIVAGFYPDPSVCKKGENYYLVNSTFTFFPGVPIFESKDLVNWTQIGNVLDRPSQLDLEGLDVSQGIYAPAISYNKNNDTFYMITTLVGKGGNFYVKSKDPAKGWSDPIWLPAVDGIDPSFLFEDDGKSYIVHNAPVNGTARYEGERAIRLVYFDVENDTTFGEPLEIVRTGTHVRENPIWIEGPHLYHVGEWYYLMCAEGGTDENHSEVIFRSKAPEGPWEESPYNPILTQREGLEYERQDKVTSTGHADLIQDKDGNWWAVFLGCRPYEGDMYNTGRETFLLPVTWRDGWPIILEKDTPVPTVVKKDDLRREKADNLTGNFEYTDNFSGDSLDPKWIVLRNPIPDSYSLIDGGVTVKATEDVITEPGSVSAIFRRQQHTNFSAETELDFNPQTDRELAGMLLFQKENFNFIFGKTKSGGKETLVLMKNDGQQEKIASVAIKDGPVRLKIVGNGRYYSFYYKMADSGEWLPLAVNVDASNLSTAKARGFIGAVIGLYATSGHVN